MNAHAWLGAKYTSWCNPLIFPGLEPALRLHELVTPWSWTCLIACKVNVVTTTPRSHFSQYKLKAQFTSLNYYIAKSSLTQLHQKCRLRYHRYSRVESLVHFNTNTLGSGLFLINLISHFSASLFISTQNIGIFKLKMLEIQWKTKALIKLLNYFIRFF